MLIGRAELIANIGGDARLDAARTQRNQSQSYRQPKARVIDCQRQMPKTIDNGEKEDGAIFPEKGIPQKRSQ